MISRTDIAEAVLKLEIVEWSNMIWLDYSYEAFELDFLEGEFTASLAQRYAALDWRKWLSSRRDCDKFSWLAKQHAHEIHAFSSKNDAAAAFGLFMYFPEAMKGEKHCVNFAVTSLNPVRLALYEPQPHPVTGIPVGVIAPTRAELHSCDFLLV
jgi:hypothetical protein